MGRGICSFITMMSCSRLKPPPLPVHSRQVKRVLRGNSVVGLRSLVLCRGLTTARASFPTFSLRVLRRRGAEHEEADHDKGSSSNPWKEWVGVPSDARLEQSDLTTAEPLGTTPRILTGIQELGQVLASTRVPPWSPSWRTIIDSLCR